MGNGKSGRMWEDNLTPEESVALLFNVANSGLDEANREEQMEMSKEALNIKNEIGGALNGRIKNKPTTASVIAMALIALMKDFTADIVRRH